MKLVTSDGIIVESRYNLAKEIKIISQAIAVMPEYTKHNIIKIFDDSKCGCSYVVTVRYGYVASPVIKAFEDALIYVIGGHNGIGIEHEGDIIAFLEPVWEEEMKA